MSFSLAPRFGAGPFFVGRRIVVHFCSQPAPGGSKSGGAGPGWNMVGAFFHACTFACRTGKWHARATPKRGHVDRIGRSTTRSRSTRRSCPRRCASSGADFPEEPYRQRLGAIAERIRRTRAAMTGEPGARTGGYASAGALDAELGLAPARAGRGRPGPRGVGRGRRPALAAADVRVPPRLARGAPARRRPPGGARGVRRDAGGPTPRSPPASRWARSS